MNKYKVALNNGRTLAFLSSQNYRKRTYLFLSPGASDSTFFVPYLKYLKSNSYLIPDYPGRGDSDPQVDNSVSGIAKAINSLVEALAIRDVTIIAFSYGTQISLELAKLNPAKYKQLHLVAGGQFYKPYQRYLYNYLFSVPFFLGLSASFVRALLIKLHVIDDAFPTKNLVEICAQWRGTLAFAYPKEYMEVPIYLYKFASDSIVYPSSVESLAKVSNIKQIHLLQGNHPMKLLDYSEFEKKHLQKILG